MLSEDKFAVEIGIWNITYEESDQDKDEDMIRDTLQEEEVINREEMVERNWKKRDT